MLTIPVFAFFGLWIVLAIYSILTAIDFGAGSLYAWGSLTNHTKLAKVVDAYASPVWESINAFIILFMVGVEAYFPRIVNIYATLLILPAGISFVLLSVRQIAFALRHEETPLGRRLNPYIFGLLGPFVPLPMMTFFAIIEGHGFRMINGYPVDYNLWTNPISLSFMLVALFSEFFLGSLMIAWFSHVVKVPGVASVPRKLGIIAGILLLVVTPYSLWVLGQTTPGIYPTIIGHLAWFILALLLLFLAIIMLALDRLPLFALIAGGSSYLLGFIGVGLMQIPYLIRNRITLDQAFTNSPMAHAITWAYVVGMVVVVLPATVLLTIYLVHQARRQYLKSHA